MSHDYNEPKKIPQNPNPAGDINRNQALDPNAQKRETTEVWLKMIINEISTI